MRRSWIAFLGVIILLGGGAVYASRAVWRPTISRVAQPALPVARPFSPTPSTPTTSTAIVPPTPVVSSPVSTTTATTPVKTKPVPTEPVASSTLSAVANPFVFEGVLPMEVNLAVPFSSQAPKQNWDMPYQEACEETSLLMVQNYLKGKTTDFTPDEADRLILALVAYETAQGLEADISLGQVATVARERYGLHPVIQELTNISQVKNALANGYPVILPASGKALKNPNFRNGGPPYHMLVAKGYLKDGTIITNDPGTRNGKNYLYPAARLFGAIHDWNGGDVLKGRAIALVLLP